MTRETFESQLREMSEKIAALPADRQGPLVEVMSETRRRYEEIQSNINRARDALDDWRIVQKYRIFDAEASRREQQAQGR